MSTPPVPVVLVPGLGLDGRSWSAVRRQLPGPHDVALLPSQGLPAPWGTDLSVPAQAERVRAAVARRWPQDVPLVFVGHSAGCPVAVEVAAHWPRVTGLVLVGPITEPTSRSWPRTAVRWLRTARHEQAWEVPQLVPQYARTGLGSLLRGMDAMRWYRTGQVLEQVTARVTVVRGEHDHIAPADWVARLTTRPGARMVTVPGAGHMVPLTDPTAVADAVSAVRQVPADAADSGS